jgi:hypothetical protein
MHAICAVRKDVDVVLLSVLLYCICTIGLSMYLIIYRMFTKNQMYKIHSLPIFAFFFRNSKAIKERICTILLWTCCVCVYIYWGGGIFKVKNYMINYL